MSQYSIYSRHVSGLTEASNNNNGGRVGLLSKERTYKSVTMSYIL